MRPKKGELQADPRFKHDKNFLVNEVAPAFLNLLIEAFWDVYENGINYQESENYFNEVIEDNNHLRRFAKEFGLVYTGNDDDLLSIGDIYSYLTEYYFNHGYLEFDETSNGKKKTIWLDDDKRDPVVKTSRLLKSRILELFPKAKEDSYNRKKYLCGLKFDLTHFDSYTNAKSIDNKEVEGNQFDSDFDSFLTHNLTHNPPKNDSFIAHSQTQNNLSESKTDPSLNNESGYHYINDNNEPENTNIESNNPKNESKMSQNGGKNESKMSQDMSQKKPENSNKINSFQNIYESKQEKMSQEKNKNDSETKKESLFQEVEYREVVKTINDYLEQVEKITDKNEKRLFVGNFLGKEISSIVDLSDQELFEVYKHCVDDKKIIVSNQKKEKQWLKFSEYSKGEKVYVLDNGKGDWLCATTEEIYSYGIKVKLDTGRFVMIANPNSICKEIS